MAIRSRVLLSVVPALVLAVAASAWGQAPEGKRANGKNHPIIKMVLQRYDKDNDERLSAAELDTLTKDIQSGKLALPPGVRERVLQMLAQLDGRDPNRQSREGQPPRPGLLAALAEKVILERDVEYGHAGQRALKLDLARPKQTSDKPLPVIVFIHGGGWQSGDKASGIPRLALFAVEGNYVCASIGYRLSGEATWPAQIYDCKAAIRWLRANAKKYNLDPDKIGVWGGSAGGHLVSLLGTSGDVKELEGDCGSPGQSSRVTCVVDFCGPSDLTVIPDVPQAAPVVKLLGGPLAEKRAEAKAASPVTYVSKDAPPFLIVHGTDDRTVSIRQAEILYEALQKAGVEATFVKIEGGGHGIGGPEVLERVTAFFNKHLRGQDVTISDEPIQFASPKGPASAPAKRARP
jgi:acetyl esterase/lipase